MGTALNLTRYVQGPPMNAQLLQAVQLAWSPGLRVTRAEGDCCRRAPPPRPELLNAPLNVVLGITARARPRAGRARPRGSPRRGVRLRPARLGRAPPAAPGARHGGGRAHRRRPGSGCAAGRRPAGADLPALLLAQPRDPQPALLGEDGGADAGSATPACPSGTSAGSPSPTARSAPWSGCSGCSPSTAATAPRTWSTRRCAAVLQEAPAHGGAGAGRAPRSSCRSTRSRRLPRVRVDATRLRPVLAQLLLNVAMGQPEDAHGRGPAAPGAGRRPLSWCSTTRRPRCPRRSGAASSSRSARGWRGARVSRWRR